MFKAICFLQSLSLISIGCLTLWKSESLMFWLISVVGEEWALGKDNVVRLESGDALLTNPGAMFGWVIPFWIIGFIQITSGAMLMYLGAISKNIQSQRYE